MQETKQTMGITELKCAEGGILGNDDLKFTVVIGLFLSVVQKITLF